MAVIIPTSIASARAHALRGARRLVGPGPACARRAARFAGRHLFAAAISGKAMLTTFIAFALFAIWRTVSAPATTQCAVTIALPSRRTQLSLKGAGIGILSSWSVSRRLAQRAAARGAHSIETRIVPGAALGLRWAAAGITGYVLAGHSQACAPHALGYIYLRPHWRPRLPRSLPHRSGARLDPPLASADAQARRSRFCRRRHRDLAAQLVA